MSMAEDIPWVVKLGLKLLETYQSYLPLERSICIPHVKNPGSSPFCSYWHLGGSFLPLSEKSLSYITTQSHMRRGGGVSLPTVQTLVHAGCYLILVTLGVRTGANWQGYY